MVIAGDYVVDERGKVAFVNDFHFEREKIKRFYVITHFDTSVIRAWQGHRKETKYFYCLKGGFEVKIIKVDCWEVPSKNIPIATIILSENKSEILRIPPGYVNGFRALECNSQLLVFSDKYLEESLRDDLRFDKDYWNCWE